MARADLVIRLAELATRGDVGGARQLVERLATEERNMQHHILADRLLRTTRLNGHARPAATPRPADATELLVERAPERTLDSMHLSEPVRAAIQDLIEEQQRAELLRSHGLEPRHRILLVGPPGNGKTSLAEAIAGELGRPLLTPAYHRVIGSLLGETAGRLGKVFADVASRACVLLLDELDVVAKERGDAQETGEIKRVVSSLLLNIDALPSHVVIIGATNHPESLDRAAWRRFELRLELPQPSAPEREAYLEVASRQSAIAWRYSAKKLAADLGELSFSEIEQFVADVRRRMVLEQAVDGRSVIRKCLTRWSQRVDPRRG